MQLWVRWQGPPSNIQCTALVSFDGYTALGRWLLWPNERPLFGSVLFISTFFSETKLQTCREARAMFPWSSEASKLERATKKLCEAIKKGDIVKVRAILAKGKVDVNKNDRYTVRLSQ
jgi:hypothetical protein